MKYQEVTFRYISAFQSYLRQEERSPSTIEKYVREIRRLAAFLNGNPATKERVTEWKEHLIAQQYAPATINAMIAAVNKFFAFHNRGDLQLKPLRLQRKTFRDDCLDLTRQEYDRLVLTAKDMGHTRLALVMESVCATGIRVSEVRYLTVEAVRQGRAEIRLKGKIRTILLPGKLCRKLLKYAKKNQITSGEIFRTRSGKGLSRKQIWSEMKALCGRAKVDPQKVFPHNLRHLFAKIFYTAQRDIAKLADLLGHSSVETTRIYLRSSGREHQKVLDSLRLVC